LTWKGAAIKTPTTAPRCETSDGRRDGKGMTGREEEKKRVRERESERERNE
jgi:hypothetical protein